MQRRDRSVLRSAHRLAVQRDDVFHNADEAANPFPETRFEDVWIQHAENIAKGVMRGRSMREVKKSFEPSPFVFAPVGDFDPVIRATQHRADRHHDDLAQTIAFGRSATRVFHAGKNRQQGHRYARKRRE